MAKKLKHGQQWAAFLVAAGVPDKTIAKKTGVPPDTLSRLKTSALFRSLVREYTDEILTQGFDTILAQLLSDAPETIAFLKNVRDGLIHDDDETLKHRLAAAKMLMDPVIEKKQKIVAESRRSYELPPLRKKQLEEDMEELKPITLTKALEDHRADD